MYLLGVEEKLYKVLLSSWCKKSCTHLAKGVLSSSVHVYKIKDKEILSGVAWGLDVGQEDRTRIKSLVFAFALFLSFYSFPFLQVICN